MKNEAWAAQYEMVKKSYSGYMLGQITLLPLESVLEMHFKREAD